jgi:hypothetical protein
MVTTAHVVLIALLVAVLSLFMWGSLPIIRLCLALGRMLGMNGHPPANRQS